MSFVGLHIHSDYSLLDGASQIPQLIDRCLELDIKRDRTDGLRSHVWGDLINLLEKSKLNI